jgi:hypothetical protein
VRLERVVSRPLWLVILPASVSLAAWAVPMPVGVRRGFDVREHVDLLAIASLVTWYGILALAASVGWALGRERHPLTGLDRADDGWVYRRLTWIGALGVIGMYASVQLHSPGLLLTALREHQFNLVREGVPLAPGISTLRYATIVSGAIALHRLAIVRERRLVHVLNLMLLAGNVLTASRLALMMSVLVFAGLTALRHEGHGRTRRRIRKGTLALAALAALALLTFANYARNANFYEQTQRTTNPAAMMLSEVITYVGAPFQVAIATTRDESVHLDGAETVDGAERLLTPTFFGSQESAAPGSEWYRGRVSIELGLTTNSALAQVYGLAGLWALPLVGFLYAVAGFVMGHLSRYRSHMALGTFVIGYCFAETWRIYLLNQGIVWFLLLALSVCCWTGPAGRTRDAGARRRTG